MALVPVICIESAGFDSGAVSQNCTTQHETTPMWRRCFWSDSLIFYVRLQDADGTDAHELVLVVNDWWWDEKSWMWWNFPVHWRWHKSPLGSYLRPSPRANNRDVFVSFQNRAKNHKRIGARLMFLEQTGKLDDVVLSRCDLLPTHKSWTAFTPGNANVIERQNLNLRPRRTMAAGGHHPLDCKFWCFFSVQSNDTVQIVIFKTARLREDDITVSTGPRPYGVETALLKRQVKTSNEASCTNFRALNAIGPRSCCRLYSGKDCIWWLLSKNIL